MENTGTTFQQIREWVNRYGRNTNSFLCLYNEFRYFLPSEPGIEGAIAYVPTRHAWVGATEPLSSREQFLPLLEAFAKAAEAEGKRAILLPVCQDTAELARQVGYTSLMIGAEPIFDLTQYDPAVDMIHTAKQLKGRGAVVQDFRVSELAPSVRRELTDLTDRWLASRLSAPLKFLNTVEPWRLSPDKKYFMVTQGKKVLAYVAAVPMWARHGWYLIDLIRATDSPAGTTELLLLESMRLLKGQGYREVTLGVSPLSNLHLAPRYSVQAHPWAYRVLGWVFENVNVFYRFKSLYRFKAKFLPTRWDPAFVIIHSSKIKLKDIRGLSEAFSPYSVMSSIRHTMRRVLDQYDPSRVLHSWLSQRVVALPVPSAGGLLLKRCRFTLGIVAFQLWLFVGTRSMAGIHLSHALEERWGYSWLAFINHPIRSLFLSSLLHWDVLHLATNIVTALVFCGLLELLGGPLLMFYCYLSAMLLSNPLNSILFVLPGVMIAPDSWGQFVGEIDVGASLAIFGCAGGLSYFLKWGRFLLIGLSLVTLIGSFVTRSPVFMNHLVAMGVGLVVTHYYLRNR